MAAIFARKTWWFFLGSPSCWGESWPRPSTDLCDTTETSSQSQTLKYKPVTIEGFYYHSILWRSHPNFWMRCFSLILDHMTILTRFFMNNEILYFFIAASPIPRILKWAMLLILARIQIFELYYPLVRSVTLGTFCLDFIAIF